MAKRTKPDLRQFRRQISTLQKQGLVSSKIDAHKATPTRALKAAVLRFDDVLSGKATAVKVKATTARAYRKAGWETKGSRVIVGHLEGQSARIDELLPPGNEAVKIVNPKQGIERVIFPVAPDQTEEWLKDHPDIVASMQTGRQRWGFTVDGYPSIRTFPDLQSLLDYVNVYKARPGFRPSNLVIYRVRTDKEWQTKVRPEQYQKQKLRKRKRRKK